MNNVSLALSVSDELPLFPEEANAPEIHGLPVQASPEPIGVPTAGERLKCTAKFAVARRGALDPAFQDLTGGEILRRLLSPVLAEPDTGRAVDKLLARFGTLGAILSADAMQLSDVVGNGVVDHLQITYLALQNALREQIPDRPIIGSWSALEEYAAVKLRHSSDEKLLALFLDRGNGLIHEQCLEQGACSRSCFCPRLHDREGPCRGCSAPR